MLPPPPPLPPSLAAHIDSTGEIVQGAACLGIVVFIAWLVIGEAVMKVNKSLGTLIVLASLPVGMVICAATYWLSVTA